MSFHCTHCQAEIQDAGIRAGQSIRCEHCGAWVDTNFLGRVRKNVGIHPALARRYRGLTRTGESIPSLKPVQRAEGATLTHIEPQLENGTHEESFPQILDYELTERIGKGAMGSVYRARHLVSGREAAVKVLSPELSSRHDLVARFEREAAALRSFRHPNVVAIFDSGSSGDMHYYCMEYVHGTNLRRYLKNGPLPIQKAVAYMRTILRGLKAAHERGIIHRDLKPENVLVEETPDKVIQGKERLVLVDFGLAGILNDNDNPHPNLTRSRVTMGTVNYMAPEQHVDAKRADFRTDIYACGVILYECITGDLPLGRYALPTERGIRVPKSVDSCLTKALARSVDDRYQSVAEFDEALKNIEEELENINSIPPPLTKLSQLPVQAVQPIQKERKSMSFIQTLNPTQWMSVPPWIKRPGLILGFLALAAGLVVGIFVAQRVPHEVVVSEDRALPIYAGVSILAPVPFFEEGLDVQKKWKGDSPVWNYEPGRMGYFAKQADSGHFRRDFSLIVSGLDLPAEPKLFSTTMTLERVKLPLEPARAQYLARELLGGTPELPAGGIFYVNEDKSRAIGTVFFVDGSCGLAELQEQNGFMRFVQYIRGVCKEATVGRPLNLGLECENSSGHCSAYFDGQKVSEAHIDDMGSTKWSLGFGCRNISCLFDLSGRKSPVTLPVKNDKKKPARR